MLPLVAATFLTAGTGVALVPYVVTAEETAPSSGSWDPTDLLIQAAVFAVLLLAIALELRHRYAARRLDTYREPRNG
jgi:hypothetical protein